MGRIMFIPTAKQKLYRISQSIHYSMDFCGSATSWHTYRLIYRVFPPLALWWTLIDVESMLKFSISASSESDLNTFSNTPSSFHLRNLEYTVCQWPYFSGSSALSAVLRFGQSTSFRSTWCGYLLPVILCLYVVEVIDFLFDSIVRLLLRIYSCFYFTFFWLFVQLLFFKQCLV